MAVVFCIYCMCDLTYVWIYTHCRHKAEQVMSLCNKYYTRSHTGELGTDGIAAITIINYVQTLKAYIVYRLWCRLGSVGSWSTWIHIGQIRFYAQNLGTKRQGSGIIFTQNRSETLKLCRYIHMVCILCVFYIFSRFYNLTVIVTLTVQTQR